MLEIDIFNFFALFSYNNFPICEPQQSFAITDSLFGFTHCDEWLNEFSQFIYTFIAL